MSDEYVNFPVAFTTKFSCTANHFGAVSVYIYLHANSTLTQAYFGKAGTQLQCLVGYIAIGY